jgi:hypothetical protein
MGVPVRAAKEVAKNPARQLHPPYIVSLTHSHPDPNFGRMSSHRNKSGPNEGNVSSGKEAVYEGNDY